jgi:4,5-dihydroxyphthalate decarboxylase
MGFHDIFARFLANREWDVSELSFAKFIVEATRPNSDIIGLPVFLRREFRFGIYYVNRTGGIRAPEDLRGKRIGLPEWAQTACVYTRGFLQRDFNVALDQVDWIQAGINEKGRAEKVEMTLPSGVRVTAVPDKTLDEMLVSGEIDCLMGATTPKSFGTNPDIVRLFPNAREMDERFFARTKVYPIMHVVAMRKDILREHPWIARNLYDAFDESKRRSQARLRHGAAFPLPWLADHAEAMRGEFGSDFFPCGIEENRAALELFLRYAHEQGLTARLVQPEDIFPAGLKVTARV